MIIQTDGTEPGPYIYDGASWQYMLCCSSGIGCQMSSTTSVTDVTTNGGSDGTATTNPVGGTIPYSYQWNGIASGQSTATATGLVAGTYCVTVTDNNNCTFTDCGITITEPSGAPLSIGDTHQGGIIFYLDGNGGGLIAAPTDQSTSAEWGCYNTTISGADGTAIGTGAQNTIDIEAGCTTANTAAEICANLTLGGYSDWFLPSKDELNLMRQNIGHGDALGLGNNIGGFDSYYYWSSSEFSNYNAWRQRFSDGFQGNDGKFATYSVRAVRAF